MPKKPRQQVRLEHRPRRAKPEPAPKPEEFRNCDSPGCPNIISRWNHPRGYSTPVYCSLHSHLEEKN